MKNKLFLIIDVPASAQSYEMRVPRQIKIAKMLELIRDFLRRRNSEYIPDENSVLCDESTGRVLDFNSFVETAGLEPGGRIMIM